MTSHVFCSRITFFYNIYSKRPDCKQKYYRCMGSVNVCRWTLDRSWFRSWRHRVGSDYSWEARSGTVGRVVFAQVPSLLSLLHPFPHLHQPLFLLQFCLFFRYAAGSAGRIKQRPCIPCKLRLGFCCNERFASTNQSSSIATCCGYVWVVAGLALGRHWLQLRRNDG